MAKSYQHLSEGELLRLYSQKGDLEILGVVLQRYTSILLGVGLKYLHNLHSAQDMVQQVFLKALEKPPSSMDNFGGWLYMVMKNECLDLIRKTNVNYVEDMKETAEVPISEEVHWKKSFQEEKMLELMKELKEEQRIALDMFYLKGKSYQDIAVENNWELKDVKSFIQNGKRNLKIKLENHLNL